ncbi:translation initiation factor IF-2-like [Varanus komodoensis]|uniref:translation initiation factor IF-2-like n=1 Tax=Varanus komodoensis TaxID=61221 RepID=UPI001CF7B1EE|nr:translation initiation factor IF-2-like [Varanus komodoensis]
MRRPRGGRRPHGSRGAGRARSKQPGRAGGRAGRRCRRFPSPAPSGGLGGGARPPGGSGSAGGGSPERRGRMLAPAAVAEAEGRCDWGPRQGGVLSVLARFSSPLSPRAAAKAATGTMKKQASGNGRGPDAAPAPQRGGRVIARLAEYVGSFVVEDAELQQKVQAIHQSLQLLKVRAGMAGITWALCACTEALPPPNFSSPQADLWLQGYAFCRAAEFPCSTLLVTFLCCLISEALWA